MSDNDFSGCEPDHDGDCPQPSEKRRKITRKINSDLLFTECFEVIKRVTDTDYQKKHEGIIAKCSICSTEIHGNTNVTSNFYRHLKLKHLDYYNNLVSKNTPDNKYSKIDDALMKVIAENMLSFSILESDSFKNFVALLNKSYKVPSRPKALRKLVQNNSELKSKINSSISQAEVVCTTADIWSTKTRSFLGYTCHWIDGNLTRHSAALACKRFSGTHSYDRINNMIQEIHNDFNLNNTNVIATVTDNGSNFIKAFKEFGITSYLENGEKILEEDEYEGMEDEISKRLPKHLRCASHTLNLLTTTDYEKNVSECDLGETHKSVLQKCSVIWNKSHHSKLSEKINSILGVNIKYPVATRWNSLYDSLKQIIYFKEKMNTLCQVLEISTFSENDFLYIEEYIMIQKPIAQALDFLQQEKNILFGYVLPTLATVRNQLKVLENNANFKILTSQLILLMEESLVKRFGPYFQLSSEVDLAIIASALCPAVKMDYITALSPDITENAKDEIKMRIKNKIEAEISSFRTEHILPEPEIEYFNFNTNSNICNSSHSDYITYLLDSSTSLDMLNRHDAIKKLFKKYNTPLPSSAPVERMFSYAGLIHAPRRTSLSDTTFEALVLMKVNSNYC